MLDGGGRLAEALLTGMASLVGVAGRVGATILSADHTLRTAIVISHMCVGIAVGTIMGELFRGSQHQITIVMGSGLVANEIVREFMSRGGALFYTMFSGHAMSHKKDPKDGV